MVQPLESGEMVIIDGSEGEGGGQVLRTALTLSLITGRPFRMTNIRAKRSKPGLKAQHLQCVRASAKIFAGECEKARKNATEIMFTPGEVKPGSYDFSIGTAGSTSLLLQTLVLPLAFSGGGKLTLSGGTHVEWAPIFDYIKLQFLPHLKKLGIYSKASMKTAGFYPKGGGTIVVELEGCEKLQPINMTERGRLRYVSVYTIIGNLPLEIAQRMSRHALKLLGREGIEASEKIIPVPSPGPGICIVVDVKFEGGACCFSVLGKKGRRAEIVATEAVDNFMVFLETNACIDEHLADQLLLPLSLADGESHFTTPKVTHHLLTNAYVIRKFLPVTIEIDGVHELPGSVRIKRNA